MHIRVKLILLVIFSFIAHAKAQVSISENTTGNNIFPLVSSSSATLYYDEGDDETVKKVAGLFVDDIYRVTGKRIKSESTVPENQENMVIVGTIGNNDLIDRLIQQERIDVSKIKGGWEQYVIKLVDNPLPGVRKALVIAGSDRRGAAYGIFSISESIGVSPWYWWADVPVKKRSALHLKVDAMASKSPSVKYRGIFINDEDWGLKPWASKTFEPEVNDIGPKTYSKICELLIRLKANYLSPAMHEITGAFNSFPENKKVADSFGIVMGSIHAEPLLFNNATEWDSETMGEWDYTTNKEGINKVLTQRVKENSSFENVYTLALRGIHDAVMVGNLPMEEQVVVLENALNDQRGILKEELEDPIDSIPQVFYPYKEVLDIYDAGLEVPDDVTIVWPDDAYGYMRRLSNTEEQKRSGRAGVYYHVSYWGPPNHNLWTATTPPALMYEELEKAYRTTADRLWLVNVGDIKPAEYQISLFMDMAYDIEDFSFDNINSHNVDFLCDAFGEKYRKEFEDILKSYYHLTFVRKPEYMERRTDTEFSIMNYKEVDNRLAEYERIVNKTTAIMNSLDEEYVPSFFQLLYYPIKGAALVDQMTLGAQKNRLYAFQERASANVLKKEVVAYIDTLKDITQEYNSLLDGKWKGMMALRTGGGRLDEIPRLDSVTLAAKPSLGISVQGEDIMRGVKSYHATPSFNKFTRKTYYIDVFNKGEGTLKWKAKASASWILIDKKSGKTTHEDRLWVSIDWDKVPKGKEILGSIEISMDRKNKENVSISVFNPADVSRDEVKGMYVEDNGYVSIDPTGFHRKTENEEVKFTVIEGLGYEKKVLQLGDPLAEADYYDHLVLTSNYVAPARTKYPGVEYDFYSFNTGTVTVYTYMMPIAPLNDEHSSRYGVMVDNSPVFLPEAGAPEYALPWIQSALKNNRINSTVHEITEPGKHTLKIFAADPGMIIQKIVIDFGGLKKSYQGPGTTKVE
jgi:hypothetical protein